MKKWMPTIVCFAVLLMWPLDRVVYIGDSSFLGLLLYPLNALYFSAELILMFIVEHLPPGPWQIEKYSFLTSSPNFSGWLVASAIFLVPVFALNYFLVVRKQYISATSLSAILVLGLVVVFVWFFLA